MLRKTFMIILLIVLSGCTNAQSHESQAGIIGENDPVTRAEASRMAALDKYSISEINSMDRNITFEDTSIDKWYDKYINAAYAAGLIAGTDEKHFEPESYLTLRQAQFLINKIKGNDKLKLRFDERDKDKPIPYSVWVAAFERSMDTSKLRTGNISIYATKEENKALGNDYMLTDLGLTYFDDSDNTKYRNKNISAIIRENTIVAVKAVNETMAVYNNVEITDRSDNSVTVQLKGGTRKFSLENNSFDVGDSVNIVFGADGTYEVNKA